MSQPRSETPWSRMNLAQEIWRPGTGTATESATGPLECFSAAVHHQRVTGAHLDTLCVRDLLELPPVHRLLRSHVVLPTVTRDIEEYSAGNNAIAPCRDGAELRAIRIDGLVRRASLPDTFRPVGAARATVTPFTPTMPVSHQVPLIGRPLLL